MLTTIQQLYDQNLYLQAYHQSAQYWRPETDWKALSPDELILGGRLAQRLGSYRLSRWLLRKAFEKDPQNPLVRYYAFHVGRRKADLYDVLADYQHRPELDTEHPGLRASWHASQAVHWACVHDFDQAYFCLEKARFFEADSSWLHYCASEVFLLADQWEEALSAAERAWELDPGKPYVVYSLGRCLIKIDRVEEAVKRISQTAHTTESFELAVFYCWLLCAWCEILENDLRPGALRDAQTYVEKLSYLAPLPDRETLDAIARARLDVADLSNDVDKCRLWAESIRSPYYKKILENRGKNPAGERIRLPFRRVSQKRETCLPSSIATVLSALSIEVQEDEIAAEITYGGTRILAGVDWLQKHGYSIRHFLVTPDLAIKLIQNHIPFVLHLEYETDAHSVAVIGLDQAAGTLLIHDPSLPRVCEFLLDGFNKDKSPLGPIGMAFLPAGLFSKLDEIIPENDHRIIAGWHQYWDALENNGAADAREILNDLISVCPEQATVQYLDANQLREEGRIGEAFSRFQKLLNQYPGCLRMRRSFIHTCRSMGNTAALRDTLREVVEKGRLPGIQADQDWWYPPATYVCQYADLLGISAMSRLKAQRMLRGVLRLWPANSEAWHVLADILWNRQLSDDTRFFYRIASCLMPNNEHYARAYCDASRFAGHETEGLDWLEKRARHFGLTPLGIEPWLSWVDTLENYGYPEKAMAVFREAQGLHGDAVGFLSYAVPFLCRMGLWQEAEKTLERLALSGNSLRHLEAAVSFHRMQGAWSAALKHARAWMEAAPQSMAARRQVLDLMHDLEGARSAADLTAHWTAQQPQHDYLEELYYQQLGYLHASEKRIALLEQRTTRNPEDAWAWRELALLWMAEFTHRNKEDREALCGRIEKVIVECDRTAPQEPATLRVHAQWLEAQCRWAEALSAWIMALESEPETVYSYRRAWEVAAGLSEETRRELFQRMEIQLMRVPDRLHIARELAAMAAGRFGIAEAEAAVFLWKTKRPDDPEVVEAVADLLLENGRGRTDAEKALALLQAAVRSFPFHSDLRFSLAHAQQALGQNRASEETLQEIVRRHPANTSARLRLAHVREQQHDLQGALEWILSALEMAPRSSEVWRAQVGLLIRSGQLEEAWQSISEGLNRMPDDITWREYAIQQLSECGRDEKAVAAARDGVALYPNGAYLQLLLARTLKRHTIFAAPGEVEMRLKNALRGNTSLFETADEWALLLAEQHRYEEAEKVLQDIKPLSCDPSPAIGRLAWLRRVRGEHERACLEMTEAIRQAPWYAWGWDQLMTWLEEDEKWEETIRLLMTAPPEMSADLWFRRRRLTLLAAAGLEWLKLESEWEKLLWDYPENIPIRLEYYDELKAKNLFENATRVIESVLPLAPDNPFVLARQAELQVKAGEHNMAAQSLLKIWFGKKEESPWPDDYAWQAIKRPFRRRRIYREALKRMAAGEQPTMRALYLLANYGILNGKDVASKYSAWDRLFIDMIGQRRLVRMLQDMDRTSWVTDAHRAVILERLNEFKCYRSVRQYGKTHPAQTQAHATWSQVGHALLNLNEKQARIHLSHWREIPGVGMWAVANYLYCIHRYSIADCQEIHDSSRDALKILPHDHTAKCMAHIQAEMNLKLNDREGFKEVWTRYRGYFTEDLAEGEWFDSRYQNLLQDIPRLGKLLDESQIEQFNQKMDECKGLDPIGRFAPVPAKSSSQVPVWIWIILAIFLLKVCSTMTSR